MAKLSKKKMHKIEVRQKEGSEGLMTGANTEVFLDGKRLRCVTSLKFEVKAKGIAKLQLEMLGDYAVSGVIGELEQVYIPFKNK